MALLYLLDRNYGFLVGDTNTGHTDYAYPTSDLANAAERDPIGVACIMAKTLENPADYFHIGLFEDISARNVQRIDLLRMRGRVIAPSQMVGG